MLPNAMVGMKDCITNVHEGHIGMLVSLTDQC